MLVDCVLLYYNYLSTQYASRVVNIKRVNER